jgi:hypothetical protein
MRAIAKTAVALVAAAFAGLPVSVSAEDWLVHAESPGYDIVIGEDVTFDWYESAWRNQHHYTLKTSAGQYEEVSSVEDYTWNDFPLGSAWWSVSVWGRYFWIGNTSKQSFYHYNNIPGKVTYETPDRQSAHPWDSFKYKNGARDLEQIRDLTIFYEVLRDYSLDLTEYFLDLSQLPEATCVLFPTLCKWEKTEDQRKQLYDHLVGLEPKKWEFIELVDGVLTLKKGYRWDGTSNPLVAEEGIDDIRSSAIHDALYDLMRMDFLDSDTGFLDWPDAGFKNKLIADIMWYIMSVEDERPTNEAHSDFVVLRFGQITNPTNDDAKLLPWKYRVSELTAWASDGQIDLHWLPANIGAKDPKDYSSEPHSYDVFRATAGSSEWLHIGTKVMPAFAAGASGHTDEAVYYTDPADNSISGVDALVDGEIYYYWIRARDPDSDGDGWTDQEERDYLVSLPSPGSREYWYKHHDESDVEAAVPVVGLGAALVLDGIDDFVEANTVSGDLSSSDPSGVGATWDGAMTWEARAFPDASHPASKTALVAFDTREGASIGKLLYDGATQEFCYYDSDVSHICGGASEYVAGDWNHVAVTIDKDDAGSLYVNGVQVATFTSTVRPTKVALFSIGQAWATAVASQHFQGQLDEVRIWNLARTQTEIDANRNGPVRGDTAGLVGLWHFDEPEDIYTAYDATIFNNDGIIFGKATGSACTEPDEPDTVPPVVLCRAPETITPPLVPVSATARATDACSVPTVEITQYDCYKYTKKGKLISKLDSCVVEYSDDTMTILDSGGVGTFINWTVSATDERGNVSEATCEVAVVHPVKN